MKHDIAEEATAWSSKADGIYSQTVLNDFCSRLRRCDVWTAEQTAELTATKASRSPSPTGAEGESVVPVNC